MSRSKRKTSRVETARRLDVALALEDYLTEHAEINCADLVRQQTAAAHLTKFMGRSVIEDIDIPACRAYCKARRSGKLGRKVSEGTIRRELGVLSAAAGHALRWKRIDRLPVLELPYAPVRGEDDEMPYYSKEELGLLFAEAEKQDRELFLFVQLLYWTGARRRSIEHLLREQVDWKNRAIKLQRTGKRATRKRQPIVPILPEMEPIVLELLETGNQVRLFRTFDFYKPFKSLCNGLGMEGKSHPHIMRHTRATHLLLAGVAPYHVARLLGDTVATIERVYGHHSSDSLASALAVGSVSAQASFQN